LLARIHDPELEQQARQFVDKLRRGDSSAAEWMAEEMHPRVKRLYAGLIGARAYEPIQWYQKLREQIAAGGLRDGEGGFRRLKLWPDLEFDVVSTGKRAYFRLLAMDPENRQWSRTFLLLKDDGWKIVGTSNARSIGEQFLRDSPGNDPDAVDVVAKREPPTQLGWQRRADGIEYRIRQEKPSWRIGETPLVYVDVRNSGDDRYIGVNSTRQTQAVVFQHGEFAWSDFGLAPTIPIRDIVTIPILLNAHWIRGNRALMLEPGRHPIRFRVKLGRLWLQESGGSSVGPPSEPGTEPKPIETLPITLVIEDEDVADPMLLARENLRREVVALPDFARHHELPYLLERLVTEHQPESIDWLQAMTGDDATIARRAALVMSRFFDRMRSDQVERFIASQMTFHFRLREQYPHGVAAEIPVEARYAPSRDGLPPFKKYVLRTTTRVLLDGRQLGEPLESDSSVSSTSWSWDDATWDAGWTRTRIPTQSLDAGKHTLKLTTQFTLEGHGRTFDGQVESDERTFRIVESTVDRLAAPLDPDLQNRVVDSLDIVESAWTWIPKAWRTDKHYREAWYPQCGDEESGKGFHGPAWKTLELLPVDLCFDVEFHIEKTGEVVKGKPLIAIRGQRQGGRIGPDRLDPRLEAAADELGLVQARIALKPSREVALSNPDVTRYFQGTITSKPVRLLVWKPQLAQKDPRSLPVPDPDRNKAGAD